MEFRILGPVEVVADGERVAVTGVRQQVALATLLLNANRVVPVDTLLAALYGQRLPSTGRSQVQIGISVLRRLLARHDGADAITTEGGGYTLRVAENQLDALRFEAMIAQARECPDPSQAVAVYRDALRLWRGPALQGVDRHRLRAAAERLDELRVSTVEDRFALELDLGRHHEVVAELSELVAEYPLRERLHGHLLRALHNCGRTAEALHAYQRARRTLVEELGLEPGPDLQAVHGAVLRGDPALGPAHGLAQGSIPVAVTGTAHATGQIPAPDSTTAGTEPAASAFLPAGPVPRLLPSDIADFTDRTEHLASIDRILAGDRAAAVPVVVLAGKGGVGKTALAVHAAHAAADRFPDGQLFVDLHGGSAHPVAPAEVLARFIRALGTPAAQIPDSLDERAEMYRNLLAGRRVLITLDDAVDESQVAPLVPGSAAAAILVTSRRRLTGLPGAAHLDVGVFEAPHSVELLARIAGPARVRAEPEAAAAVAEHCGHLPLALRIAGARLSAQPDWSLREFVARLADQDRRLDELRHRDLDIRKRISPSYDAASPQARRLFRRLALLDQAEFPAWVAAPLLDLPPLGSEDVLRDLVAASLVDVADATPTHRKYRFHGLIRVFARERLAAEEPEADRQAALARTIAAGSPGGGCGRRVARLAAG
ncbi:MAG: hypothetical protein HOW97_24065 [Catenulispora sp.]|nr:hypothetical protein [Catenulispora sp.]